MCKATGQKLAVCNRIHQFITTWCDFGVKLIVGSGHVNGSADAILTPECCSKKGHGPT